jgi:hypothetical protein
VPTLNRSRVVAAAPWVALAVVASMIAMLCVHPLGAGQVGYDTVSSVLYFDRITAGRHLEAFVAATPKALLTLVDGSLFALTHDWRAISLLALAVFGVNVMLAALLASRVAGLIAAAFAAVAFIGSIALLDDASQAYAVGPAAMGWLIAGLAVTSRRPRYTIAGVALLLAGLARFETLLLSGLIFVVLAAAEVRARRRPGSWSPGGAWWLALGLAALPLQMLHDFLLTGDPLWATEVPGIVSASSPVASPAAVVQMLAINLAGLGLPLLLAVFGTVVLIRRRRWDLLVGVAALGPGILAFILFLSLRGTYISGRYVYPPELVVTFLAAIGVSELRVPAWRRGLGDAIRRLPPGSRRRALAPDVVALLAGGLFALAVIPGWAPLNAPLQQRFRAQSMLFENERAALPALARATSTIDGIRAIPANTGPRRQVTSSPVVASGLIVPRLAVDLNLPLTSFHGLPAQVDAGSPELVAGRIIYRDAVLDPANADLSALEATQPTTVGDVRLTPVYVNAPRHIWVTRAESATGAVWPLHQAAD